MNNKSIRPKEIIKKSVALFFGVIIFLTAHPQTTDKIINVADVTRIEKTLSADDMQGRKTFTPGIEKAANFIAGEFKEAGMQFWNDLDDYRQKFSVFRQKSVKISGQIEGRDISPKEIIAIGTETSLKVDENSGFDQITPEITGNLLRSLSPVLSSGKPAIVWVPPANADNFERLRIISNRPLMEDAAPVIFILHEKTGHFTIDIRRDIEKQSLENIIGVIPGKSRKNEYVIFSAHYDHLGIGKPDARGDSVYNGANDNASGATAVIMLAKYFNSLKNNERTLLFVAFTAEEIGGYGSRYFSDHINPDGVAAMFNIEMIGTDSKWGKNSAYITGYEQSDFGKILQENLRGSKFHFKPDPYPDQQLFYRSDNAALSALGVPAHTISTSKMDIEPHYHKQSDEIETLDMTNMTEIIKSIAISSKSIISGKDTPVRVERVSSKQ